MNNTITFAGAAGTLLSATSGSEPGWSDSLGLWTRDGNGHVHAEPNHGYYDVAVSPFVTDNADGTWTGTIDFNGSVGRDCGVYFRVGSSGIGGIGVATYQDSFLVPSTLGTNGTFNRVGSGYYVLPSGGPSLLNITVTLAGPLLSVTCNGSTAFSDYQTSDSSPTGHIAICCGLSGTATEAGTMLVGGFTYVPAASASTSFTIAPHDSSSTTLAPVQPITLDITPSAAYPGTIGFSDGLSLGIGTFAPTSLTWSGSDTTTKQVVYTPTGASGPAITVSAQSGSPSASATALALNIVVPISTNVVMLGDSRTNGANISGSTNYSSTGTNVGLRYSYNAASTATEMPAQLARFLGPDVSVYNAGIIGASSAGGLTAVTSTYSSGNLQHPQASFLAGKKNIVVAWYGANDPNNGINAAQTRANLTAICAAYKAAGPYQYDKVLLCTEIDTGLAGGPGLPVGTYETAYQIPLNTDLRANWQSYGFDGLIDIGSIAEVGLPGSAAQTSAYFIGDELHPNSVGAGLIANAIQTPIRNIVSVAPKTLTSGGTVPAITDVRSGVAVGSSTGTLVVPMSYNVLSGTTFDHTTAGTLTLPPASDVLSGVAYGAGGNSLTGTLTTGSGTAPTTSQIASAVQAIMANSPVGSVAQAVTIDQSKPLSTAPTAGTVGEALAGARADALAKEVYDPNAKTLSVYAHDNTTILKVFNVTTDSSGNILSRS